MNAWIDPTDKSFMISTESSFSMTMFFIRANSIGGKSADYQISIGVYDCVNSEEVFLSSSMPILPYLFPAKINDGPQFKTIDCEFKVNTTSALSLDLFDRFVTTNPFFCPITHFNIFSFQGQLPSPEDKLSNYVSITSKGMLIWTEFGKLTQQLKLVITACNVRNKCSQNNLYLVSFKFIRQDNQPPYFTSAIMPISIVYNPDSEFNK